jgi:helix-turn-helix protein
MVAMAATASSIRLQARHFTMQAVVAGRGTLLLKLTVEQAVKEAAATALAL